MSAITLDFTLDPKQDSVHTVVLSVIMHYVGPIHVGVYINAIAGFEHSIIEKLPVLMKFRCIYRCPE